MPTIHDAVRAWQANDFVAARALCAALADTDPHARYMLGSMASFGQGGPADPSAAAAEYRAAADAGHAVAAYCLGALYAQGRGVPPDLAEARRWYETAAAAGEPAALFRLGTMHATGEGVEADLAAARRWWERAAAAGHPGAMQALGRLYVAGEGGYPRDPGRAAEWFFRAWQGGQDDAEQDIIRVREALEDAAEGGAAAAQNALGLLFCFGHDDPAVAAAWFDRAAEQGYPEALRMLATLVAEGRGVEKDVAAAAALYRRAADRGDSFAQFNLAGMIDRAEGGLARDVSAAIGWFRRAADQGMTDAAHRLAELLAERNRDRRDANEAVQRLMAVATAGPADAAYRLDAGDGSWAVVMKDRGRYVAMPGLDAAELVGLPDPE